MWAALVLAEVVVAVLDTAPLVYYLSGRADPLGGAARRLLRAAERRGRRRGALTISLFEIAQLEERGRVQLSLPYDRWCQLVEDSPPLLPLERSHVSEAGARPALRDPFDRLIAGTAAALGKNDLVPRQLEFYEDAAEPKKRLQQSEVRAVGAIPVAHDVEVKTVAAGTRTDIDISDVQFNQKLNPDLFTQRALERGER